MTTQTAAHPDLSALTDQELGAMYGDGTGPVAAAAIAEARRRDRRDRRRLQAARRREAIDAAWHEAAHAEYLAAEAGTCGVMLSAAGDGVGRQPFPLLWTCSEADFARYASEEMKRWRAEAPAFTRRAEYFRQASRPYAGARPWDDETEGTMAEGDGGLAEFGAPAEDGPAVAVAGPDGPADPAGGESVAPAGGGDSGAAQRRAERAARAQVIRAEVAGYAPASAMRPPVVARPVNACAGCAGPANGPCKHPGRWAGTGGVIEPAAAAAPALSGPVLSPARQMPDAPELLRAVLDATGVYLTDYVWFKSRSAAVAAVLWVAHAAPRDAEQNLIWWTSPNLIATSAMNGSGKSTLFDLFSVLLKSRAGRMAKVTPAGLTYVLGKLHEVGLADDAQNMFGATGTAAKDLQSIMQNSYTRGGTWVDGTGGGKVKPIYGPLAIAGKDQLITTHADALVDILNRSVILRMARPPRYMPAVTGKAIARGRQLADALAAVTGALAAEFVATEEAIAEETAGLEITEGDGGRTAQIWRPLHAVAQVAGGRWPQAAVDAAAELTAASGDLFAAADVLAELGTVRDFWAD